MLSIYVAGDSGGFLNSAITFNFCLFRKLPWRRFPIYFLTQFLGGFFASGVVYANYINGIKTSKVMASAPLLVPLQPLLLFSAHIHKLFGESVSVFQRVYCEYDVDVCDFCVEGR
jgi:glycerol uptake facilitator-like aquaporin